MNLKALKAAEQRFLKKYPGGFGHPEMLALGKKHKLEQFEALARETFQKRAFDEPEAIVAGAAKLVSRSTLVSMFEKPKFKDMANGLNRTEQTAFAKALGELLHGKEKAGFEALVTELAKHQLAKWSIATILQTYYRPQKDVFIKPTTTKLVIDTLELDLTYQPGPTWDFYRKYRKAVKSMRAAVSKEVSPDNPGFLGFLSMSLK